jgi:hypothetical protein
MSEHVHHYKVTKESVFGLQRVHAVLECVGIVNKLPCRDRLIKVLAYGQLEKKGNIRVTYFYREPETADMGGPK